MSTPPLITAAQRKEAGVDAKPEKPAKGSQDTSAVAPVCETPIATSSLRSRAAEVSSR